MGYSCEFAHLQAEKQFEGRLNGIEQTEFDWRNNLGNWQYTLGKKMKRPRHFIQGQYINLQWRKERELEKENF